MARRGRKPDRYGYVEAGSEAHRKAVIRHLRWLAGRQPSQALKEFERNTEDSPLGRWLAQRERPVHNGFHRRSRPRRKHPAGCLCTACKAARGVLSGAARGKGTPRPPEPARRRLRGIRGSRRQRAIARPHRQSPEP